MRKSGLAAATGFGALVLLLSACGGSGSNTAAGSPSSTPAASSAASGSAPSTAASSATAASTATKHKKHSSASAGATPRKSVAALPSSGDQSIPPIGTTVMIVQKSAIGYVLAQANHQVVYTYSKDKKNGKPTCTSTCAQTWLPSTGMPQASPADVFSAPFGLVTGAGGVKQITYDGYPLYLLKGAKPLSTSGNGQGGVWHVVPLSAANIRA